MRIIVVLILAESIRITEREPIINLTVLLINSDCQLHALFTRCKDENGKRLFHLAR